MLSVLLLIVWSCPVCHAMVCMGAHVFTHQPIAFGMTSMIFFSGQLSFRTSNLAQVPQQVARWHFSMAWCDSMCVPCMFLQVAASSAIREEQLRRGNWTVVPQLEEKAMT